MQTPTVTPNGAGQRIDKPPARCLDQVGKGFLYKTMRKKNITLNGKKRDGSEHLAEGDEIQLPLSDETISKFQGSVLSGPLFGIPGRALPDTRKNSSGNLDIIYEDNHILVVDKSSDMLSQKVKKGDMSLNGYILNYLIDSGGPPTSQLWTSRSSTRNRLDCDTSGLVVAGKSPAGLQIMDEVLRDRSIHKYYQCLVSEKVEGKQLIAGFPKKSEGINIVSVYPLEVEDNIPIMTEYLPLAGSNRFTLLRVTLITGRSHQVRAHLSSMEHSIVGDYKYGSGQIDDDMKKKYKVRFQLFHSWRLELPKELPAPLDYFGGGEFIALLPGQFARVLKGEGIAAIPTGKL